MSLIALLVKEALQHTVSLISVGVLAVGFWLMALSFALSTEASTLLTAATSWVYYLLPLGMAFIVRRLVVMEYEQHTHDFLAGLPISALLHTGLKYVLGFGVSVVMALIAVAVTALLSSRQELISARFLLQVCVQCSAYVFAWYGVLFMAAHLGRFRFAFWLLAIAAMLGLEQIEPDIYKTVLWHASLGESLDVTRLAMPWAKVGVSLLWGGVATVIGMTLGTWQQGAVSAAWFTVMSTREKTFLVLVVVSAWLGVDLIEYVYITGGPAYTRLADSGVPGVVVRTTDTPRLTALGQSLAVSVQTFGVATGDEVWPTLVLVPVVQQATDAVVVRSVEHDELVLELDLTRSDAVLHVLALDAVLDHRAADLPALRPELAWIADGAAMWWLRDDPVVWQRTEALAGLGWTQGITAETALSTALRQRVGPDVAMAVGAVGLSALQDASSRETVTNGVARVLRRRSQPRLLTAVRTDLFSGLSRLFTDTGVSHDALAGAWTSALQAARQAHAPQVNAARPQWGVLTRVKDEHIDAGLSSRFSGTAPGVGMRVMWTSLDPLQRRPIWVSRKDAEIEDVTRQQQVFTTAIDSRRALVASYIWTVDSLDAELWSGVQVMP